MEQQARQTVLTKVRLKQAKLFNTSGVSACALYKLAKTFDIHQVSKQEPAAVSESALQSHAQQASSNAEDEQTAPVKTSLLAATAKARKGAPKETEDQKRLKEEQEMLHNITNRTALKTFAELAQASVQQSFFAYRLHKNVLHILL